MHNDFWHRSFDKAATKKDHFSTFNTVARRGGGQGTKIKTKLLADSTYDGGSGYKGMMAEECFVVDWRCGALKKTK